jgi:hypothetical protein
MKRSAKPADDPDRFRYDPTHLSLGLNTQSRLDKLDSIATIG